MEALPEQPAQQPVPLDIVAAALGPAKYPEQLEFNVGLEPAQRRLMNANAIREILHSGGTVSKELANPLRCGAETAREANLFRRHPAKPLLSDAEIARVAQRAQIRNGQYRMF